ncbi:MAG: hypothetical protein IPK03_02600 [Bacteroidetes bacterium]|nr:hypothetical protein [Bacteroidota bacterium]
MKHVLLTILILFSLKSFAQLNGAYTVNATLPATSGNYQSIVAAVFDLTQTGGVRPDGGPRNGPNVSGPVIINIANGTYRGKLALTTVVGTSATNTITFKSASNTPTSVIIQDSMTNNANNGIVQISGCSNVIFQRVTIRSMVTGFNVFATGVLIDSFGNNTCNNVKILNCRVGSSWYVNTNTNQQAAIAVRGFQTNTVLNNDTIYNCAYGIFFDGNRGSNNYTPGLTIDSCYFAAVVGSDAFQPLELTMRAM